MLPRLAFAIVISMSTLAAAQSLPVPRAVTDPAQLQSAAVWNLQKFSIAALYSTRQIGGSAWSPDGSQVAFIANISGRNNLWTISATGGWPTQLTISDQRQTSPAWSPDGKWIAYISDKDGNELWNIFLVSPLNGEVTNLTAAPDAASEAPARSPDGRLLAYTQENASGKDSNIFLYDLAANSATNFTPHSGDQTFTAATFSPDGKSLLITSNAVNGYDNVALLDIASKHLAWITDDRWEIRAGSFSPDGHNILWAANVDGRESLFSRPASGGQLQRLPLAEGVNAFAGNPSPCSRDGQRLLYSHSGASAPTDLYVLDLKSGKSIQLTNSLVAGLTSSSMIAPTLVHYPSKDGKFTISAWVYIPNNIIRNGSYPAIVYIHGGPASQSMDSFNRFIQYISNQGYLVIAPNYRGGTGYGRDFQEANRHDAGGEELNDVLGAADFIRRTGFVDPAKLVVMGGSYGGYLTMMAVTRHPELWAAGVPIVPFVNWFTEFENEDPQLQESDRLFMGDPVKDKALWEDRSPIHFIDRVKAPLLILAGANDPRCPKTEAEQVAEAIKKQGGTAILKIYENEGHGFARVENQIDAYQRVADFLRVRVPSPGCGCGI
jgi:dipeptidyl aminopeptidase/acylaminoacyl peptidase